MSPTKLVTERIRKNIGTEEKPVIESRIVPKRVDITEDEVREAQADWEFYRGPADEPYGRRVAPDGTVLEEDVLLDEKIVAEHEKRTSDEAKIEAIELATTVGDIGQKAGIKQEVLDILVKAGVVTLDEAEAMGWTPPAV